MNARLFHNPDHLFEVFTTVTFSPTDTKGCKVSKKVPSEYSNEEILSQIPKFAYPCKYQSNCVEHYTFVLTDGEAKFFYGFCRLSPEQNIIYCILSRLPWFDVFYKLLNKITDLANVPDALDDTVQGLLDTIHSRKPPPKGEVISVRHGDNEFSFSGPDSEVLPTIPANRNLTEFYSAVDYDMMIRIFTSLLNERRLLITSKKLSKLTACCHAAATLLYPCYWQHLFIPVLPEAVIDFVAAPMPFIIGIHHSLLEKARSIDHLSEVILVDVDQPCFSSDQDDRQLLPSDVISSLKKSLKSSHHLEGDNLSRAFLRCLAQSIGDYRACFRVRDAYEFDRDLYISCAGSTSERSWREKLVEQQYFSQFIDERLMLLADGDGINDEFEVELRKLDNVNESKYKEFLSTVKKKGNKLRKQGQHTVVSVGKKVQDVTKKTYKDLSAKLKERSEKSERFGSDRSLNTTPRILPSDNIQASRSSLLVPQKIISNFRGGSLRARPPPRPTLQPHPQAMKRESYDKALKYRPISFDDDDIPPSGTYDLLNDPDLKGFLPRSQSSGQVANLRDSIERVKHHSNRDNASNLLKYPSTNAVSSLSAGSSPVPPPRRKKQDKLIDMDDTDGSTEGFEDNFADHVPSTSTISKTPLLTMNSEPDEIQVTSLSDFMGSSSAQTPVRVASNSLLTDLAGLDLSLPTTTTSAAQTPAVAVPNNFPSHVSSEVTWQQSQPCYNINITPSSLAVKNRASTTNPFAMQLNHSPITMMPASNGYTPIGSSYQFGHGSPSLTPVHKVGPPIPPRPARPDNNKDPFADLQWKS